MTFFINGLGITLRLRIMAYFKKLEPKLESLLKLLKKDERWLIIINPDPDALASAMALKRILVRRVENVGIAMTSEIKRPDNLAMIHYLHIPVNKLTPLLSAQFDRFALVDSQPHHAKQFSQFSFSIVVDHHPISKENPVKAEFVDIRPDYGATSTIFTEYLYNLKLKPGKLLSTALLYGIKTDTHSFEHPFNDADIKAFRYLSKFADTLILRKIAKSEFKMEWLKYFLQALKKLRIMKDGITVYMGEVDSADVLVILADFFMRVHDISWDMISGITDGKLIVIFRSDGIKKDVGKLAARLFGDVGKAGGHKTMARAEVSLNAINTHPQQFIWERLKRSKIIDKIFPELNGEV